MSFVKTKPPTFSVLTTTIIIVSFLTGCGLPIDGDKKIYLEDGTLQKTKVYEDGNISKIELYNENGTLKQTESYHGGRLSKAEFYLENGNLDQIDNYKGGILSDVEFYRGDGTLDHLEDYIQL